MRPDELVRLCGAAPPAGAFLLTAADADGFDTYIADGCVRTILTHALPPEQRSDNVYLFSGDEFDVGAFLAACQTLPMFGERSVLVCRRAEKLPADTHEPLMAVLANVPDTSIVVFVAPKLDGRLKFTKFLKKSATEVDVGTPDDPAALGSWVERRFADHGKRIDARLARTLALKAGRVSALADQVDQIALYVGDDPDISPAAVEALWREEPSDNVFGITDALGARDSRAALAAYYAAERAGAHHLQVIALVESAVRRLVGLREGLDAGLSEDAIAKRLGVRRGAVYHLRRRAEQWNTGTLRALHARVLDLEYATKSGGGDARLRVEAFLAEACG